MAFFGPLPLPSKSSNSATGPKKALECVWTFYHYIFSLFASKDAVYIWIFVEILVSQSVTEMSLEPPRSVKNSQTLESSMLAPYSILNLNTLIS